MKTATVADFARPGAGWISKSISSAGCAVRRYLVSRQLEAELDRLPDDLLRDIGINRGEIRSFTRDHASRSIR